MEENEMTEEEEIPVDCTESQNTQNTELVESAKRLKTNDNGVYTSTSNDCILNNLNIAGTSFPRATNSKSRNYRKAEEGSEDSSPEAVEPQEQPVNQTETSSDAEQENESDDETIEQRKTKQRKLWYMTYDNTSNTSSDPDPSEHESLTTDSDSEDSDHMEDPPVLSKEKPKHKWFMVPEIINRQIGSGGKYNSAELFQQRCYGSLHSVQRLELMYKLEKHEGCVNSLNFHPNGTILASGSDDLSCVIWDWPVGKPLLSFDTKHKGNVFQTKFMNLSGDLHIVTCARDGQVRLHHVSRNEGVRSSRRLGLHRGPTHKLALPKDQPHVVLSAGDDGVVFSHDVRVSKSNKLLTVTNLDEPERKIALYSINSNPLNSEQFCVSGREHIVRIYDQRNLNTVMSKFAPVHKKKSDVTSLHVTCAVYNYNGTEIVASYSDDDIYLFDTSSSTHVHCYQGHRNGATIKGVNFFGPKSEFIVSGSDCGNVYFWDKSTEAIVQSMLADDNGVVNCLEPHPQLPIICTSGLDWDVKVWVPSHEHEPQLAGLAATVRRNHRCRITERIHSADINDSQMLWMLWRHLRTTERLQRTTDVQEADELTLSEASSENNSSDQDEDIVRPLTCSPS